MINILWYEARGEGVGGASLVYDVVQNRAKLKNISVCDVMREPKQFSFYNKSFKLQLTYRMLLFYDLVLAENKELEDEVMWFHVTSIKKPIWTRAMEKVRQYKKHVFYKLKEKK